MKTRLNNRGYVEVRLSINGKTKTHFIHRLLAEVFIDVTRGDDVLYTIQIYHDSIGFSRYDESDFSTVPDERYYNLTAFLWRLSNELEKS